MAKKYKMSLNLIGICLLFMLVILVSYMHYQNKIKKETPLVIVDNGLSINYRQGNLIDITNKIQTYTFSITNNAIDTVYYYIHLENVPDNLNNIVYTLKEENKKLDIEQNELLNSDSLASNIEINAGETHSYELIIYGKDKRGEAVLNIGIETNEEEYFATTIINDNKVKKEAQTKIGEEAATSDEGLIETTDDLGITYYFRGNVQNNYVSFANLTWRIVRINGDGSIRLVLNDYISTTSNFYDSNSTASLENKLDFLNTNLHKILKDWYEENLNDYDKYIASIKYCIDDSTKEINNEKISYLGNSRLLVDHNQVYNCLGKNYASKIGLLTADEVVFAGATNNNSNTSFYLYTPDKTVSWWTMTPSASDNNDITFFEVSTSGKLQEVSIGSYYRGIKPVINLLKKNTVSGVGTLQDPYIIKD